MTWQSFSTVRRKRKLTTDDVDAIRYRRSLGEGLASLAECFDVSMTTIHNYTSDIRVKGGGRPRTYDHDELRRLSASGLKPKAIARHVRGHPASIRVVLSRIRRALRKAA